MAKEAYNALGAGQHVHGVCRICTASAEVEVTLARQLSMEHRNRYIAFTAPYVSFVGCNLLWFLWSLKIYLNITNEHGLICMMPSYSDLTWSFQSNCFSSSLFILREHQLAVPVHMLRSIGRDGRLHQIMSCVDSRAALISSVHVPCKTKMCCPLWFNSED